MISLMLKAGWVSKDDLNSTCLSADWQLWKVNQYSLHLNGTTCSKIQVVKEQIFGFNPNSNMFYEKNFHKTCSTKSFFIFFLQIFSSFFLILHEIYFICIQKAECSVDEIFHIIWFSLGIEIACLYSVCFDSILGALLVSQISYKLNHEIPIEVYARFPYRHIEEKYNGLRRRYKVHYVAPCMQPLGNADDLLKVANHILDDSILVNRQEYDCLKNEKRFELLQRLV